jgi:conjugative transfer signal peptidase TraF
MVVTLILLLMFFTFMGIAAPYSRAHYFINVSPSLPCGLYKINKPNNFKRGDLIIFNPPETASNVIERRHWLPKGWPLLKHIGAVAGDTYCVTDSPNNSSYSFYINDEYIGPVSERDSQGLPLTHVKGCHVVKKNNFLPVSTYINNSFDGRYFGEIPLSSIQGIAEPILTF